jgi:iduronate 2-sulfatase
MRRSYLAIVLLLASPAALVAQEKKLNVILIVADDLRNDLGCYGHALVKSPNIDRLAKKGMRFDRAFVQYPVCNPSRTSFMTGLRPDTTKILGNNVQFRTLNPDVVTLAQLFRMHGYFTASIGKIFHRGQTIEDVRAEMDDPKSWDHAKYFVANPIGLKGEGRNMTGGKLPWCRWLMAEGDDDDQPDGMIAKEAVRLLNDKHKKPFFLAVGFHRPHDPFNAPKKYYADYPLDKVIPHKDPEKRSPEVKLAIPKNSFGEFTDRERKEFLRAYYAGVAFMDAQVGRLFAELDRLGLWENTIVIFVGDHGYHLGEHGWWNKSTIFELSARAPSLVWAPPMKAPGQTCERLVEFIDLYPTVTELCKVPAPKNLEGLSFTRLLDDPKSPWKSAAFTQVQRGKIAGRSMRTERYRFNEWDDGKAGVELYDHTTDPGEYQNLALSDTNAALVREMQTKLRAGWKAALPAK